MSNAFIAEALAALVPTLLILLAAAAISLRNKARSGEVNVGEHALVLKIALQSIDNTAKYAERIDHDNAVIQSLTDELALANDKLETLQQDLAEQGALLTKAYQEIARLNERIDNLIGAALKPQPQPQPPQDTPTEPTP